jgi:hypothetical protein
MKNIYKSGLAGVFLFMFIAQPVAAFCTWGIMPPEREYEPVDATEVFISYEDGIQTLVLKPEWQGNAKEFAIVYPTPSKPEVNEAPKWIFDELDTATNPWPDVIFMADDEAVFSTKAANEAGTVAVVEEKQVGEYEVTVLTATDADDLVEYLEDNGYNYTKDDASKVEYYVAQGGFYFIALKVDMKELDFPLPLMPAVKGGEDSQKVSIMPRFFGELSPIQIAFKADIAQLPMRTLKSQMPEMTFDLYTLSERALFVPGVDTVYSNIVDAEFLSKTKSLQNYNPKGKWMVRQEVRFNPAKSDADLYLKQATTNDFTTVTPGTQVRFDPSELVSSTGVLAGTRGQVVYTDGHVVALFARSLAIGSVGEDVRRLQQLLNDEGFVVSDTGAGSKGSESTYFGNKTKTALIRYQNFYRSDILTPVGLSVGTGYFGPSTIKHINR